MARPRQRDPLDARPRADSGRRDADDRTASGSCSILLADDDRALCDSLVDVLELRRHRVEVVHDGEAVTEACGRRRYDVLLLDISLPDVTGTELISEVERIQPELEILVITGHASMDSAVSAVSRSTIGYLIKPLDLDRLLSILAGIARRRQIARENERLIARLEERNAELERYAYTVSHDLRSPLITIKGFVGLAERSARDGDFDRLQDCFRRIEEAAGRMLQLLEELLELSRIGRIANPPEEIDMTALAAEAVELTAPPEARERIDFLVARELPPCRGDRVRLLEVLQNLIENAIKFMGDQADPRIVIGARSEDGETVYFVADNGIGIDPPYRDKVFGMFDKLDPRAGGTGIGLALVKRIVEVHGGRVWMESEGTGSGSTFCFTVGAPG